MTSERIQQIQAETAYVDSVSVQQALLKVWNECERNQKVLLTDFAEYLQKRMWDDGESDLSEFVDDFLSQQNNQSNPFESEAETQDRVVEVRQYEDVNWHRRVLITEKKGKFVCWKEARTIEEINTNDGAACWNFMRELPIKTILTKTEIAEKFGVDVENLEIR